MLVAAIQMNSGSSHERNLAHAGALLRRAAQGGAELAVLPENFSCMIEPGRPLESIEEDGQGVVQDFLSAQARELGMWIVGGTLPIRRRGACRT
jgi:nitrilase